MMIDGKTLVIPEKTDIERDAVASEWSALGGKVMRLGRFWDPPETLTASEAILYGNDTFCLVLEQKLGLRLISPPDDLIARIDSEWLGREITIVSLGQALALPFPCFVKPLVPKQFTARVYPNPQALSDECEGLSSDIQIVLSSIVDFRAEARAFTLGDKVLDVAVYEGTGPMDGARDFLEGFIQHVPLPSTGVIDVGYLNEIGWVFIEANASWGAGLNGCDPQKVIPAIYAATRIA